MYAGSARPLSTMPHHMIDFLEAGPAHFEIPLIYTTNAGS